MHIYDRVLIVVKDNPSLSTIFEKTTAIVKNYKSLFGVLQPVFIDSFPDVLKGIFDALLIIFVDNYEVIVGEAE